MSTKLKEVNELLKASMTGTESLNKFVDAYYDGFEELRDGFQVGDAVSLLGSFVGAFMNKELAWTEAMDLQDNEVTSLINRSDNFDLGNTATEARQILKLILVGLQTYDVLVNEIEAKKPGDPGGG